ncbi:MAG: glutathione S-transferase family protein [Kordiimonas sp.]
MTDTKLKLYSFPLSGHAHRIRLALSLLGLEAEIIDVDLAKGEHKSDWFTELNPAGKVPVLVDGETVISESTAILTYLGRKHDNGTWLPEDAEGLAATEQWFVSSATGLANGPARARLITLFNAPYDQTETIEQAHAYLANLNGVLEGRSYLVADRPTFADVAIYTYVAHAPEGHVSLDDYANINAWLKRVEKLNGFVPMQKTDVAAAA